MACTRSTSSSTAPWSMGCSRSCSGLGYAAAVLVGGQLAGQERSNLVVAGSTLAVAAVFQPARRRVQAGGGRRFNRHHRCDAAKTMEAFSGRLREEIDLDTLSAE